MATKSRSKNPKQIQSLPLPGVSDPYHKQNRFRMAVGGIIQILHLLLLIITLVIAGFAVVNDYTAKQAPCICSCPDPIAKPVEQPDAKPAPKKKIAPATKTSYVAPGKNEPGKVRLTFD